GEALAEVGGELLRSVPQGLREPRTSRAVELGDGRVDELEAVPVRRQCLLGHRRTHTVCQVLRGLRPSEQGSRDRRDYECESEDNRSDGHATTFHPRSLLKSFAGSSARNFSAGPGSAGG